MPEALHRLDHTGQLGLSDRSWQRVLNAHRDVPDLQHLGMDARRDIPAKDYDILRLIAAVKQYEAEKAATPKPQE